MVEDIEVRQLKQKDLFAVINIIGQDINDIKEAIKDIDENTDDTKLGIMLFSILIKKLGQKNAQKWLASLVDKDYEEFMEMDINASLRIIEQLKRRDDIKDFLHNLANLLQMKDIITDS